jgi:hypothetical protein
MGSSNLKERALAGQAPRFGWNICCHNVPKMSMSWVGAATGLLGGADRPEFHKKQSNAAATIEVPMAAQTKTEADEYI